MGSFEGAGLALQTNGQRHEMKMNEWKLKGANRQEHKVDGRRPAGGADSCKAVEILFIRRFVLEKRETGFYLQVADDAVVLRSVQATGGGRREVGSPTDHQVSGRWVAASLCATVRGRRELLACHGHGWGNREEKRSCVRIMVTNFGVLVPSTHFVWYCIISYRIVLFRIVSYRLGSYRFVL